MQSAAFSLLKDESLDFLGVNLLPHKFKTAMRKNAFDAVLVGSFEYVNMCECADPVLPVSRSHGPGNVLD